MTSSDEERPSAGGRTVPEGHVVKYVHRRRVVVGLGREPKVLPTGGETVATIYKMPTGVDPDARPTEVAQGVTRCRPDENFNRALGREIALGRALVEMFPREPLAPGARRYDPESGVWR